MKAGLESGVEETSARGIEGTVIAMNGAGGSGGIEKLTKAVTEKVVGKVASNDEIVLVNDYANVVNSNKV